MDITLEEKKILMQIAKEAIQNIFYNKDETEINIDDYPFLQNRAGAFVTLKKEEALRGCIGYIVSDLPLAETLNNAAVQAAIGDPRFPKLNEEELSRIELEISILSEPFPMNDYEEIELGKHGLILEESFARALLLPQVPIEHNMTLEEFLSSLCRKAGLSADYWKQKKINIQLFTANVFSEKDLEE